MLPGNRGTHMAQLKLRLLFDHAMLGPGKAQLLDLIQQTGSISAAGREMGMSYKRAWLLVEEMNAAFRAPLIARSRGGAGGGGAHLTPEGTEVLTRYHAILEATQDAAAEDIAAIEALLAPATNVDMSGQK